MENKRQSMPVYLPDKGGVRFEIQKNRCICNGFFVAQIVFFMELARANTLRIKVLPGVFIGGSMRKSMKKSISLGIAAALLFAG